MGFEIERKFLVDLNNEELKTIMNGKYISIKQGYIFTNKYHPVAHIKLEKEYGLLTLKPAVKGFEEQLFQYKIPLNEAQSMFQIATNFSVPINENTIQESHVFNDDNGSVVRVRVADNDSYLTFKTKNIGITRNEFEYKIPLQDGLDILESCSKVLEKNRFIYALNKDLKVEIDLFTQIDLCLAEVELPNEHTIFQKPLWLLEDVSHESKYYNNNIIKLISEKKHKNNI